MKSKAFTLVELVVVILLVATLAGAVMPLLRGRMDDAKWSEANAAAGMIRNAAKVQFIEDGEECPLGTLDKEELLDSLQLKKADLTGSYFVPGDYEILRVGTDGMPVVQVTGSLPNAPKGSRILGEDGSWTAGEQIKE